MASIVYTQTSEIVYARAFFLTSPSESPLMPGERRGYPLRYAIGSNEKATAYRLDWYANQADADARGLDNRGGKLTDAARLPTAEFLPATPNASAGAEVLQDGTVILTAPATNGYENPVAVIEMVQATDTISPYVYLVDDEIEFLTITTDVTDYPFRYRVGNPPATAFLLSWFETRLDALLMVQPLEDANKLPRAVFIPATPNASAGAEVFQDGILRLYPPEGEPYTSAVGLLCMVQDPIKTGDQVTQEFTPGRHRRRRNVFSNWRRN